MPGPIIVGFDGSEIARAAVAYAVRRAGAGKDVVVAHVLGTPTEMLESPYFEQALERAREHGSHVLEEAKGVLPHNSGADLRLIEGPAARALVELAREVDARELVVGSRGFGALRAAALGSTSLALLHETDRPVTVIPRQAAERELRLGATPSAGSEARTIVVGYDGSPNARKALDYAVERASELQGDVVAVCAAPAPREWLGRPYFQHAMDSSAKRADEIVRGLDDSPGVEADVLLAPPVEALTSVAQARNAAEIVVGGRGLGRFRAALGSVSYGLLHEADRPVVVVPHHEP